MSSGDWIVVSVVSAFALLAAAGWLQWLFRLITGAVVAAVVIVAVSMSHSDALAPAREVVNEGQIAPEMARQAKRAGDVLQRLAEPNRPEVLPAPAEPPKIVIVTRRSDAPE
jgi:hypothetical protein